MKTSSMDILDKKITFIIGAQKCGTTAVHKLLSSHPEISLPSIKETHYFSSTRLYEKGTDWYYSHFDFDKKTLCEVDPSYLFVPESCDRIRGIAPDSKFIVIFRKPIDRALSQYLMSSHRGYEKLSFIDALKSEKKRLKNDDGRFSFINHSYALRGNYAVQLNRYLSNFDKSNFLFIKFDDLISNEVNKNILESICSFIGVDSRLLDLSLPKLNNKKKIKSIMVRNLLYKESLLKRVTRFALPSNQLRNKIKSIMNSLNSTNYSKIESENEIDRHLISLPQEYIDWNNQQTKLLSEISNLDLDSWIIYDG